MSMSSTPPLSPLTSAQNETSAISRHVISFGAGIFTVLGVAAILPPDQVAKAVTAVQDIGTHVQAIIGDVYVLIPIISTAVGGFMAWKARLAASLPGQLKSITRNPDVVIPPGSVIVAPPDVAAAVPSPQVVAPS